MLVGRSRELATIEAAVARGRGVVVVTGEAGIGKTSLLAEAAARVQASGGRVAWGRMVEVGETPAFWPWLQILAALDARVRLGDALVPAERVALFGEIAAAVNARAPVALLFDDAHVADLSSLQLLDYVMPLLGNVLVVVAARDGVGDATAEVAGALARIRRGADRLVLGRLARDDVRAMVGEADADRIYELSAGNPLFVEELAGGTALGLPPLAGVRAVLRERVARLPAATGEALIAAAIVGREARGQVVSAMVGAEGALAPAVALGVLAEVGPDRYRFSHAVIAETIAAELAVPVREAWHERAARAIAMHEPERTSAIAHHLLAAGASAIGEAVVAVERAAEDAMRRLAFEDAAVLYERALAVAPGRAELMCLRAEALQHAGQHAPAAELCEEAARIARARGDRGLLARIALARGLEMRFGRTDGALVAMLREALEGDVERTQRAKLLARYAAALQPADDPWGPIAIARDAMELARGLEARDELDVRYVASSALIEYVEANELERVHEETLALARTLGARMVAVHTQLRICYARMQRGDRPGFEVARTAFAGQAEALGLPRWLRNAEMLAAVTAVLDGAPATDRTDGFEAVVHRGLVAWVRTEPMPDDMRSLVATTTHGRGVLAAWTAALDGDLAAARLHLAGVPEAQTDPILCALHAHAVAVAGDDARADGLLRSLPAGGVAFAAMVGYVVVDLWDRLRLELAARLGRGAAEVDGYAASALAMAARLSSPLWAARVKADWADAVEKRGDRARAVELRAEVRVIADKLALPGLVARCGERSGTTTGTGTVSMSAVGALWSVRGFGEDVHVKASRGVEILARLVGEPNRELHVLDLVGSAMDEAGVPMLDVKARAAYRARAAELIAERDEAESFGDAGRLARATHELDALTSELERAYGLGGRARTSGGASERARSNVQRRVAHAIEQIRAASPRLGEHLSATIRTGTFCVYRL